MLCSAYHSVSHPASRGGDSLHSLDRHPRMPYAVDLSPLTWHNPWCPVHDSRTCKHSCRSVQISCRSSLVFLSKPQRILSENGIGISHTVSGDTRTYQPHGTCLPADTEMYGSGRHCTTEDRGQQQDTVSSIPIDSSSMGILGSDQHKNQQSASEYKLSSLNCRGSHSSGSLSEKAEQSAAILQDGMFMSPGLNELQSLCEDDVPASIGTCQTEHPESVPIPLFYEGEPLTIYRPTYCPSSSEIYPAMNEAILYLESVGIDCRNFISQHPEVVHCHVHPVRRLIKALKTYGLKTRDLIKVFHMCPKALLSTSERDLRYFVRFLLHEVELCPEDISKVIRRCPALLTCNIKQIRPNFRFLRTLGILKAGNVIAKNSQVLYLKLEKLASTLSYLEGLGCSHEQIIDMIARNPAIFNYNEEEVFKPKYEYLVNEMGLKLDDLVSFPQYFGFSLENRIKPRHQCLSKLNIRLSLEAMLTISDLEFDSIFQRHDSDFAHNHESINSDGLDILEQFPDRLQV